jgi:hypothetical protein
MQYAVEANPFAILDSKTNATIGNGRKKNRARASRGTLLKKNPPLATGPSKGGNAGKLDQFAAALCVVAHTPRRKLRACIADAGWAALSLPFGCIRTSRGEPAETTRPERDRDLLCCAHLTLFHRVGGIHTSPIVAENHQIAGNPIELTKLALTVRSCALSIGASTGMAHVWRT